MDPAARPRIPSSGAGYQAVIREFSGWPHRSGPVPCSSSLSDIVASQELEGCSDLQEWSTPAAMSGPTQLTLPQHLIQAIKDILDQENLADFPQDLRDGLNTSVQAAKEQTNAGPPGQGSEERVPVEEEALDQLHGGPTTLPPSTIDIELVERLSSWAVSDAGVAELRSRGLGE